MCYICVAMGNEDIVTVSVKVSRPLREYLVCVNGGSDILVPDYGDPLWTLVKSHLQLMPDNYVPHPASDGPSENAIRIALPTTTGAKPLYNLDKGRVINNNFLFRCFLDADAQRKVEAQLSKIFKDRFRHFMAGYLADHDTDDSFQIKDAIDRFCSIYRLEMDSITYEMLRKDWYRFRNRETPSDPCTEVKENI